MEKCTKYSLLLLLVLMPQHIQFVDAQEHIATLPTNLRQQQIPRSATASNIRFAIGVVVCSAVDYLHHSPRSQLLRAQWWLRSLDKAVPRNPQLDRVVLMSGFHASDFSNQTWDRILEVPQSLLSFKPRFEKDALEHHDSYWVNNNGVQKRHDGTCTSLKLAAWNRTDYAGIILSDADVCFLQPFDALGWMMKLYEQGIYFQAHREHGGTCSPSGPNRRSLAGFTGPRCYDGLNTHMMYLRPDKVVGQLLLDKAKYGDFVPFTNTEQDVLETVFSAHAVETNMNPIQIKNDRFGRPIPHIHHRGRPGSGNCKAGAPYNKFREAQDRNNSAQQTNAVAAAARASEALYLSREFITTSSSKSVSAASSTDSINPFAVVLIVCENEAENANAWLRHFLSLTSSENGRSSNIDFVAITSSAYESDSATLKGATDWTQVIEVPTLESLKIDPKDTKISRQFAVLKDCHLAPFKTRLERDKKQYDSRFWVENNNVHQPDEQQRADCSLLKLAAWELKSSRTSTYYHGVLLVDSPRVDLSLSEHIHPEMPPSIITSSNMNTLEMWFQTARAEKTYFSAIPERGKRSYDGLKDELIFLKPNPVVKHILAAKVRTGDVIPYANTFQDIIETVFSPHAASRQSLAPFLAHMADKEQRESAKGEK